MPDPGSAPTAALVTGGARRIGRAIAVALAETGRPVVVHCNASRQAAEETAADIVAAGGRAAVAAADLSDPAAAAELVPAAGRLIGGPIGCLVNNASIFENDRLSSFAPADFDRNMAVHARAPALLAQAMAAQSPAPATGVIVNLLDQKSFNPDPAFFSYTISKFALLGLTQVLARALAPDIRVNGVALGLTLPPPSLSGDRFRALQAETPLGQGASVADVVAAVRFLVETGGVTGETILVDGGEHMGRRSQTPTDLA